MDNGKWILYWRLSDTSTLTHQNLFVLGLPPVNLGDYKTYSELVPQSQGGQVRQGYINIRLLWDELTAIQFRTLTRITETALTSGLIYATIPKDDGTGINAFIDVHGIPLPLTWQPLSNGRGVVYSNVTLTINAIVVDLDPAVV